MCVSTAQIEFSIVLKYCRDMNVKTKYAYVKENMAIISDFYNV